MAGISPKSCFSDRFLYDEDFDLFYLSSPLLDYPALLSLPAFRK
jgi:hypothetical protein